MSRNSTAFNLDYGLAMMRSCYDGYSWSGPQTTGDIWGCIGQYYSGKYLDNAGKDYTAKVQAKLLTL